MDLGEGIRKAIGKITGKAIVDESAIKALVKDLQRALLISDVNIELVYALSKTIQKRSLEEKPALGRSLNEHVTSVVYEELTKLMGEGRKLELGKQKIMLIGLFGSGKTTMAGKISKYFKQRGMTVGVIAADMVRPAAYEQLQQLAEKVGCEFYGEKGKKAEEVVKAGMEKLKTDIIIVDTSGRDALDGELKGELLRVNETFQPDERLLVMSADIGQIARKQAEEFNSAVGLTGVILTKMDGSGKGGGALTAAAASKTKIVYIGVGEKLEDIEEFDPEKFVGRLLGVPDFAALIEKIKATTPEMEDEGIPENFDMNTFYKQIKAARKLGPLKGIMQMMGMSDLPKEMLEGGEKKLDDYEYIISSMTKKEKADPEIIKKTSSRMNRIAMGSGKSEDEVRKLINEFLKMKKMLDKFGKNKGMQKKIEKMFKSGKMGGGMASPFG